MIGQTILLVKILEDQNEITLPGRLQLLLELKKVHGSIEAYMFEKVAIFVMKLISSNTQRIKDLSYEVLLNFY